MCWLGIPCCVGELSRGLWCRGGVAWDLRFMLYRQFREELRPHCWEGFEPAHMWGMPPGPSAAWASLQPLAEEDCESCLADRAGMR